MLLLVDGFTGFVERSAPEPADTTRNASTTGSGTVTDGSEDDLSAKTLQRIITEVNQINLEPVTPTKAIEMYLTDRADELTESSLRTHRSALGFFRRWCSAENIENLNELTGRHLHQYRIWRRDDAPEKVDTLNKKTDKTQQDVIRTFIEYCESIDAVKPDLHEKVRSPEIKHGETARDIALDTERATAVLEWLCKYEYASVEHVIWALLTETGVRTGTLHSLDITDYGQNAKIQYITIRNRPETGTTLKNGDASERWVALDSNVCGVIDDYLDERRPDSTDEYGRKPLLTAGRGRLAKSTIRKYVYKWTRPCVIGHECPHDRQVDECEATNNAAASKCPSSRSAHAVRRGYITHELSGVDRSAVSERCDVSEEVIREHYDARDEGKKMSDRQQAFEQARKQNGIYGQK
jgi:site-specific recombinase XerD